MKTLRLLILFSLVILGAYVEDKANEDVLGAKREMQGRGREATDEPGGKREQRNAGFKNAD